MSLAAALACTVCAAQAEIYTYDETEDIMNGVTLRHIQRFDGDGWLNINAVIADLSEPHVRLDLLKGANIDSLTSMAGLTSSQDGVLAASNADFFDNTRPAYSQGFSLGIEVKDGELLQSQIDEDMAAAFYDGRRLDFSYMNMSITVTAPNGETRQVRHLNKHTDYYGELMMYTSGWNNGLSPAPGGEVVEVVVDGGIVTDIRRNQPPAVIPENGCVLDVSEGVDTFFYCCFSVGDPIEIEVAADPSLEGVKTAFGGGTMLLKDGVKTEYTHVIAGAQPRTCVGTNGDGTVVYIITVDGRQAASKGVTMSELTDIAVELGCVNVLNLDGGGSTRLLAKTFWNSDLHVINLPTENRKVINAVSVTTDARPGEALGLKLRAENDAVLVGDSLTVEGRYYDENGLTVWTHAEEPVWTVNGTEGRVENGQFYPITPGSAEITALYGGTASEPLEVRVIGGITDIAVPETVTLNVGESYRLSPGISDGEREATVKNIALLSPTIENSQFISYDNGVLTGLAPGYSLLTLSRDGVSAHCLIKVGEPDYAAPEVPHEDITDPAMGAAEGGLSFGIFAFEGTRDTLFNDLLYQRGLERVSELDSYGFLGEYRSDRLPSGMKMPIKADTYSAIDRGFALVISLPSGGRLSSSNWLNMAEAVASTSAGTVIVMTKSEPNGAIPKETEVFYDYLSQVAESKNVFIVRPGLSNSLTIRDGVRILTLADSSDYASVPAAMENTWILRFTIDGDECGYEFEKMFE